MDSSQKEAFKYFKKLTNHRSLLENSGVLFRPHQLNGDLLGLRMLYCFAHLKKLAKNEFKDKFQFTIVEKKFCSYMDFALKIDGKDVCQLRLTKFEYTFLKKYLKDNEFSEELFSETFINDLKIQVQAQKIISLFKGHTLKRHACAYKGVDFLCKKHGEQIKNFSSIKKGDILVLNYRFVSPFTTRWVGTNFICRIDKISDSEISLTRLELSAFKSSDNDTILRTIPAHILENGQNETIPFHFRIIKQTYKEDRNFIEKFFQRYIENDSVYRLNDVNFSEVEHAFRVVAKNSETRVKTFSRQYNSSNALFDTLFWLYRHKINGIFINPHTAPAA